MFGGQVESAMMAYAGGLYVCFPTHVNQGCRKLVLLLPRMGGLVEIFGKLNLKDFERFTSGQ